MHGNDATNVQGLYPIMFGTREKLGMIQDIRDIKWYGKLALWALTIIGGAILVAMANLVAARFNGGGASTNTQSVNVSADDDASSSPLYTTAQVSKLMGYSTREIQSRAQAGEIPGAWKDGKEWRFDRPSVDAFIAANAANAANAVTAADAPRDAGAAN